MSSEYPYDAFISYSSADKEWARFVDEHLTGKGYKVYRDEDRLIPGEKWPSQLQQALARSRHLILLWSGRARESDWVLEEMQLFRTELRKDAGRRIFAVFLEGDYAPWGETQAIRTVKEAGGYASGPQALAADVRDALFEQLVRGLGDDEHATAIPLLVVTAKRSELEAVDWTRRPALGGPSLDELLPQLNFDTRDDLLACYGERRSDWRPFGSASTIRDILGGLRDDINKRLKLAGARPFRWEPLTGFWGGSPEEAVARVTDQSVFVVLDPVALYEPVVHDLTTDHLVDALNQSPLAVVLVLPPVAPPTHTAALRASMKYVARPVFRRSFEPYVKEFGAAARYMAAISDEADLRVSLMSGIGALRAQEATKTSTNAFTQP